MPNIEIIDLPLVELGWSLGGTSEAPGPVYQLLHLRVVRLNLEVPREADAELLDVVPLTNLDEIDTNYCLAKEAMDLANSERNLRRIEGQTE